MDLVEACLYEALDIYPDYFDDDGLLESDQADLIRDVEQILEDEFQWLWYGYEGRGW